MVCAKKNYAHVLVTKALFNIIWNYHGAHCYIVYGKTLSDQYFHFEKLAIPMTPKWSFLHVLNDFTWFRTFFILKKLVRVWDI